MLIFIFAFSIRVHHLTEKKGFHGDELLSLIITDYETLGWGDSLPDGEYTGREFRSMYLKFDPSFGDAKKDIALLWDSNRDTPHTNLYYTFLRLSLIGATADTYEEYCSQFIFRSGALNLVIFTFTFFAFFALLKFLIKDKTLILLGLAIAFFNTMDISQALFFREYALQTLFVVVFTLFMIWVSKKVKLGEYKDSWQNLFIFALPLSLMLLSGYYTFIYAFLLGIFFVAFPLRQAKRLDLVAFFFFGSFLAVLLDLLFYHDFLMVLSSGRTEQTLNFSISEIYDTVILVAIERLVKIWFLVIPAGLVFLGLLVFVLKNKRSSLFLKETLWFLTPAFVSVVIIMIITPLKLLRFIVPFIPVISLILPIMMTSISRNVLFKRMISFCIIIAFALLAISGIGVKYKFDNNDDIYSVLEKKGVVIEDRDVPIYIVSESFPHLRGFYLFDDDKVFLNFRSIEYIFEKIGDKECVVLSSNYRPSLEESYTDYVKDSESFVVKEIIDSYERIRFSIVKRK